VIVASYDSNLSADYYERSVALGNRLAAANLAHRLVAAGFIGTAELLLDRFEDGTDAQENYSRARAAVLAARRDIDKKRSTLESYVDTQFARYRSAVMDAYRFLRRHSPQLKPGVFLSEDKSVQVYVSNAGAACRLPFGNIMLEGVVPQSGNCFFGDLSRGTGILDLINISILVSPVDNDHVRLLQFPKELSRDQQLTVIELTRVDPAKILSTVHESTQSLPKPDTHANS
jgi:hypothetical protein